MPSGAAFIGCQRQAGEGIRLFALGDQPRARRGEIYNLQQPTLCHAQGFSFTDDHVIKHRHIYQC